MVHSLSHMNRCMGMCRWVLWSLLGGGEAPRAHLADAALGDAARVQQARGLEQRDGPAQVPLRDAAELLERARLHRHLTGCRSTFRRAGGVLHTIYSVSRLGITFCGVNGDYWVLAVASTSAQRGSPGARPLT